MRLGDVCIKIGSGATPRGGKDAYKIYGTPLIRSQNVLDFSFSKAGLAFIDSIQAKALDNVTVHDNDVLINITGDSVARVCMVPADYVPARVNQHVAIVRTNSQLADSHYILYHLQFLKSHLLSLASSGATRNALTKQMIENLEINLPPLSEQIEIGRTLRALDDKIANNTAINHHLASPRSATDNSPDISFGRRTSRVSARCKFSSWLARILENNGVINALYCFITSALGISTLRALRFT